jgi:excisionase family DNA binding protein
MNSCAAERQDHSERLLLTVGEMARALALSKATAERLVARGAIATIRIGRCRRVTRAALEAYIAERERAENETGE